MLETDGDPLQVIFVPSTRPKPVAPPQIYNHKYTTTKYYH